jgi:hypothetical protein
VSKRRRDPATGEPGLTTGENALVDEYVTPGGSAGPSCRRRRIQPGPAKRSSRPCGSSAPLPSGVHGFARSGSFLDPAAPQAQSTGKVYSYLLFVYSSLVLFRSRRMVGPPTTNGTEVSWPGLRSKISRSPCPRQESSKPTLFYTLLHSITFYYALLHPIGLSAIRE